MGRHAAADDAGTDPIVAAALASQADGPAVRRSAATAEGTAVTESASTADGAVTADDSEGDLGWPGDTTTGGGLGWPGSTDRTDEADATARMDAVPAVPDGGSPGPRGWRRLFGGHAA